AFYSLPLVLFAVTFWVRLHPQPRDWSAQDVSATRKFVLEQRIQKTPVKAKEETLAAALNRESNSTGVIRLPLRTWVERTLPKSGQGPCPTGCKHMRLAHNPDNGRIYFLGGDYSGPGAMSAGRNEVYSYSIGTDSWKLEYP